jgi:hypothetical protein
MNNEQLQMVEREVLGLSGVWKKREENGPGGIGVTSYRLGRRRYTSRPHGTQASVGK